MIYSKWRKRCLFECESKPVTGRILVRIVEYAVKIGLEEETAAGRDTIIISIPRSAILTLRSTENTPDILNIVIKTENGQTSAPVRVMKLSNYTAESVMEKKLYLLIPFLLFNREKQFRQIQEDDAQYEALMREYAGLFKRLDELIPKSESDVSLIDVYTNSALRAMTHTVADRLAEKYPRIKEGVNSVVGGNIIMFDALKIKMEGLQEGKVLTLYECVQDGDIPLQKAAKRAGLSESDFIRNMNAAGYRLPQENRA